MNAPRDPDRLIHDFVLEGAERLHDQVYDAIRADIERRPQRVVIGPWRMPTLNRLVPLGLGTAAAVVVLVLGVRLLGSPGGSVGGPGVGSSPSPVASVAAPSPSASASAWASALAGLTQGSSHVLWDGGGVGMTVTIPAAGWDGQPGEGLLIKNESGADPPAGAGVIVFPEHQGWRVPSDPCHWQSTTPDTAVATVDALVAALKAQASRAAAAPVAITLDGRAGRSITLHVPNDTALQKCDSQEFCTIVTEAATDCARYAQGPGQIDVLWIVKVDGFLVVIDAAHYDATPPEHVTEMEAIVASVRFG
jgi:hypothetical protein